MQTLHLWPSPRYCQTPRNTPLESFMIFNINTDRVIFHLMRPSMYADPADYYLFWSIRQRPPNTQNLRHRATLFYPIVLPFFVPSCYLFLSHRATLWSYRAISSLYLPLSDMASQRKQYIVKISNLPDLHIYKIFKSRRSSGIDVIHPTSRQLAKPDTNNIIMLDQTNTSSFVQPPVWPNG